MDTHVGVTDVADLLGVPRSTVSRWCRDGWVPSHKDERGHRRLARNVVDGLVRRYGSVPFALPAQGRCREELLVLAALVRVPRGLPSARAVGAACGLAPTTASKYLHRLADDGLVEQRTEPRIVRGRSRTLAVWYADLGAAAVQALLPYLHQVRLPDPPATTPDVLPPQLWHLFWNADPRRIDPRRDAAVVAHRAMTTLDPEALAWSVRYLPPSAFEEALSYRGVPAASIAWLRACRAKEERGAAV